MVMSVVEPSRAEMFAVMPERERRRFLASLSEEELAALEYDWEFWARPKQLEPRDEEWLTWVVRAGRGFGKTRTGASWFHKRMMEYAGRWGAMVAKTPADARDLMIEGPGGILKNVPPWERPLYEPSKRRLTWNNGSWATIYSSEEPEGLRGFSGDTSWLDELAKYDNPREVWDNLQFGMREASDTRPRNLITTTPKPLPLLEEIEAEETTRTVVGSSYENRSNLSPIWFSKTLAKYEGTRLGEQEIHAKILDDVEGRVYSSFSKLAFPEGNVDESVRDLGGELLVGQDFNVNPMASVLGIRVVDELHILDALELNTSNTEEVATEIRTRYPNRKVIVCPDPAGKARHTNAPVGQTDFTILESFKFEVRAPLAHPPVVDRVNNANAMYCQGSRRRVRIHPRAKSLITALNNLQYKKEKNGTSTSIRDKNSGFDHVCDAADYLMWQEFNILTPDGKWGSSQFQFGTSTSREGMRHGPRQR